MRKRRASRRITAATFDLPPNAAGIDISQAQTALDWQAVKAAGHTFCIIRASQGKADSRPVGADTGFRGHIDAALAAGMGVGVYLNFLGAVDGVAQADFFLSIVAPYLNRLSLPVAVDVETSNDRSPELVAKRLYALLKRLEARLGYKAMIYTSPGVWNRIVGDKYDAYFAQHKLWVAHHTDLPTPLLPRCWKRWRIWQWQVRAGGIPGYPKRIDLNRTPSVIVPQPEPFRLYTPFQNNVITSRFDDPRDYRFAPHRLQKHEGIDSVDGDGGSTVYCGHAGTVVKVGFDARGYGNYCIIDFGGGWKAWFAHFQEIRVKEGQNVATKQPLGVAGSTGSSTGIHCHITLTNDVLGLDGYVVAHVVNPEKYLIEWSDPNE